MVQQEGELTEEEKQKQKKLEEDNQKQLEEEYKKPQTLNEKMDLLLQASMPKNKKKRNKQVLKPKFKKGLKKKLLKNELLVFYIKNNKSVTPSWLPVRNGLIFHPETEKYHQATSEYVMNYEGIPFIIQPEWSLIPFSPSQHLEITNNTKNNADGQQVIIRAIEQSQLKPPKKKMGGKSLLIFMVIGVVILYLLSQLLGKGA